MDVQAYLERIGYSGATTPTLETLRGMHRAHCFNVPFENLDIKRGVQIKAGDAGHLFEKIVSRRRGGFCLELTGLFARVLRELGFKVDVLGARVFGEGFLSYPNSHMVSIVHLDEPWIADVGFGGRLIEPLRVNERGVQEFHGRRYIVANDGDHWFVTCHEVGNPSMAYTFTLQPREFSEFAEVCSWLQASPDSRFTQGDVTSLATPNGRYTIAERMLIVTSEAEREERELASDDEKAAVLLERFGIDLDS